MLLFRFSDEWFMILRESWEFLQSKTFVSANCYCYLPSLPSANWYRLNIKLASQTGALSYLHPNYSENCLFSWVADFKHCQLIVY